MKKEEFLERLEYLLQDIPEDDKRDAIDYYRDYLEEAGTENEESVLREFGSPERIASIIRTDLLGGMEGGGEFTENGFADERFAKPELPAVSKQKIKEEEFNSHENQSKDGYIKGSYADQAKTKKGSGNKTLNNWLKFFLILIGVLVIAPIAFTMAIGLLGGAIGIGGSLLAVLLVVGILTFVGFGCGILFLVIGFSQLFISVWMGIALIGLGLAFLGAGCLLLICSVLFYGSFLPWVFKGIFSLTGRIFGRKSKKRNNEEGEK